MLSWLQPLFNFLGGPIIQGMIDAYKAKLTAETDLDKMRTDLAVQELSLQAKEAELQTQYRIAEIGHWYEPDKLMGYSVAVYLAKLLIWDKVLGWGTTDPLVGWVETTANLVVSFFFAKRGIENAIKIIKTR